MSLSTSRYPLATVFAHPADSVGRAHSAFSADVSVKPAHSALTSQRHKAAPATNRQSWERRPAAKETADHGPSVEGRGGSNCFAARRA